MPSLTVIVDDNEIATAGAPELNLLSASVCGGAAGRQSLSVAGIGYMDENECEHLTWVLQQIDVGQSIELQVDRASQFSTADRSVDVSSIDELMQRLQSMEERVDEPRQTTPPDTLIPGLSYSVQVNSDSPVIASLDGFDQIAAEVMWRKHTAEYELTVMSISVKPDGDTTQKYWLQFALKSGDRVKIEVNDAPNRQSRSAAIRVA